MKTVVMTYLANIEPRVHMIYRVTRGEPAETMTVTEHAALINVAHEAWDRKKAMEEAIENGEKVADILGFLGPRDVELRCLFGHTSDFFGGQMYTYH